MLQLLMPMALTFATPANIELSLTEGVQSVRCLIGSKESLALHSQVDSLQMRPCSMEELLFDSSFDHLSPADAG